MALDPEQLKQITDLALALDIEELTMALEEVRELREGLPESNWMKGFLAISIQSSEALLEYRIKLEGIKDSLLEDVGSIFDG